MMNHKKAILIIFSTILSLGANAQTYQFPFQNPHLSDAERAKDLCSRLTIKEKSLLMMHYSPAVERLGIHQFQWWGEALHGVGFAGKAAVFPEPIGMAASFNDGLVRKVFDAVSDEIRAKYNLAGKSGSYDTFQSVSIWTPNVNIFRDPRWGRGMETYGEDPYLTSRMGVAVVNGLQGGEGKHRYYKSFACAKHYAVHSGPEWSRHSINIENLSPRDLFETYMPAFKALVQKGNVREVMCAYNRFDGDPCCSNKKLLHQILRQDWGFDGIIVTDCDAINDFWAPGHHQIDPDVAHAAARGVIGGTDLNCGGSYTSLPEAVEKGLVTESKIDERLTRLIEGRIRLGDFDPDSVAQWNAIPMSVVDCDAHRQLSLDMARQTMTLLHNRNQALPLSKNIDKVVVMGPNANDSTMLWGNYSGRPKHTVTILQGIQKLLGKEKIHFVDGCGYVTKNVKTENRFRYIYNKVDGGVGLSADIWDNTEMKGKPVAHRLFSQPINFNLNEDGFIARNVARENFSAQLKGTFKPQESETLQFAIAGDDGFRLIVNGDTLVNEWRTQSTQYRWPEVKVEAGKSYDIQIDYFQGGGGAELKFDINRYRELTDEELLAQVGDAEYVIYAGGLSSRLEGEEMSVNEPGFRGGDREDIQLPAKQRKMLRRLKEMGKKVIFVNCSGSAVGLEPELESTDAILQAWYPGEEGGTAVAETLFGDVNPSGKLPITFYKDVNQLPDFEDYDMKNRTYRYFTGKPLFPFGYGLSYTSFEIGKAKVSDGHLKVSVKNTGKCKGTEVVQLYVRSLDDAEGPIKSLKDFRRVTLEPGKKQVIDFALTKDNTYERFDASTNTMRFVPGRYRVFYGTSSEEKDLKFIDLNIKN